MLLKEILKAQLQNWIECDEDDKPTGDLVVLCPTCSEKLIDKHPRLYEDVDRNAPTPGAMQICLDCVFHRELLCIHGDAQANGGPGLQIVASEPEPWFLDGTSGGKRVGSVWIFYREPPSACEGRREAIMSRAPWFLTIEQGEVDGD